MRSSESFFFSRRAAAVEGDVLAFGAGLLCAIGESQKRAAYGIGCTGDTPPLKGCWRVARLPRCLSTPSIVEGAPSLRFLQGRVATLPTQLLSVRHKPGCLCVRGSRPSQRTRRTGHPRCCSCQQDQEPGPPARLGVIWFSSSGQSWGKWENLSRGIRDGPAEDIHSDI